MGNVGPDEESFPGLDNYFIQNKSGYYSDIIFTVPINQIWNKGLKGSDGPLVNDGTEDIIDRSGSLDRGGRQERAVCSTPQFILGY